MSGAALTRPAEIKALSGARALPALVIVLFHFCGTHSYVPLAPLLGPPVTKGYLWVEFFFALSGFLLVLIYAGRPLNYGAFFKARMARLYPVHLVTLLTILALVLLRELAASHAGLRPGGAHFPGLNNPVTFIANVFLVQAWHLFPDLSWNGMAWFVSVEFLLVLMFPVYLWLARGGLPRGLAMIGTGIAWLVLLQWESGVGLNITYNNGVFRGMADFLIGGGLALVYRALAHRPIGERMCDGVQAGVIAYAVWAFYFSGAAQGHADIFPALAVIALIPAVAFDKGFLARLFQTKPFQILGGWSYGIYMGQMFWMLVLRRVDPILDAKMNAILRYYGEPLAFVLVCVFWGALLTILIERPANRYLRQKLLGAAR